MDIRTLSKNLSGTEPERVADAPRTMCRSATVYGYKGFTAGVGTNNSADVFLGFEQSKLPTKLSPGQELNITLPDGGRCDLYDLWIQGAAQDGVYVIFS